MTSWILSPYAKLIASVLGVLLGVLVMALIAPRRSLAATASVAVAVLLAFDLLPQFWSGQQTFANLRQSLRLPAGLPAGTSSHARCFVDAQFSSMVPFVEWLKRRIPERASFAATGSVDFPCLQLNMLPRRLVAESARPAWTVVAQPLPRELLARARRESKLATGERTVIVFDSHKALLRRR